VQSLGLDKAPESHYTNDDAEYVYNVIAIGGDVASSTSIDANVAVIFEGAREGLGDQVALEVGRWDGSGCTSCSCEHVDEFEDEEAGESAAEVGDAVSYC
jgi:hypothetical protein